jgi:hypothetical protein
MKLLLAHCTEVVIMQKQIERANKNSSNKKNEFKQMFRANMEKKVSLSRISQ